MTRYLMISLVLSAVFAGTVAGDAAEKDIEWLFVQNALAHGTEEPEPSPEEAAQADQERMVKLGQQLTKKLGKGEPRWDREGECNTPQQIDLCIGVSRQPDS